MRNRKLRWVLAGLAVVSVAAVILWPRPGRIAPEVAKRIKEGIKGEMPKFGSKLNDMDIAAVIAYLRTLKG